MAKLYDIVEVGSIWRSSWKHALTLNGGCTTPNTAAPCNLAYSIVEPYQRPSMA